MIFDEWFHKEYEPADLQIKQYAERNEGLHIPATVYLEDLKKAFEAGQKDREVQIEQEKNLSQCMSDHNEQLREIIKKMRRTFLDLLWFEEHLDPYMYECDDAQKGELLKPFTEARDFLKEYKCKKCGGTGMVRDGYKGWHENPCSTCEGKGYILGDKRK